MAVAFAAAPVWRAAYWLWYSSQTKQLPIAKLIRGTSKSRLNFLSPMGMDCKRWAGMLSRFVAVVDDRLTCPYGN